MGEGERLLRLRIPCVAQLSFGVDERKSNENLPEEWDGERVRRVIAHHEQQGEENALIEDEAGVAPSETVMSVRRNLVPRVRELIATHNR